MDETESIETKGPNDRRVVAGRRREGGWGGEARTNEEVSVSAAAEKCIQRCIGDAVANVSHKQKTVEIQKQFFT